MKYTRLKYLWILVLVLVDQVIKNLITNHIPLNATKNLIPAVLSLTNLHNSGAAWSIMEGNQLFFALVTLVAISVIGWLLYRLSQSRLYTWGLILMMAGTIGNFIDRIRMGYVVDMFQLDFINFPIFNFADLCLTIGVIVLFIAIILDDRLER